MRKFYLYRRDKKNMVYYCQLIDEATGKKLNARSTGKIDKQEAQFIAMQWAANGLPTKDGKLKKVTDIIETKDSIDNLRDSKIDSKDATRLLELLKHKGLINDSVEIKTSDKKLIPYSLNFWNWNKSPYIKEKAAMNEPITKDFVTGRYNHIKKYWSPFFGSDKMLTDVTEADIKEFVVYLRNLTKADKDGVQVPVDLAMQTIKHILLSGKKIFNDAIEKELIVKNPVTTAITKNFGKKRDRAERGILTTEEYQKIFSDDVIWPGNPGCKLASILACTTGLRMGEVLSLRPCDITEDRVIVKYSWNDSEGRKGTKTGNVREVPLLLKIRNDLLEHAKKTPYKYSEESFIFWAYNSGDRPIKRRNLENSFYAALRSIGVSEEIRRGRAIVFHSHRHFFSTNLSTLPAASAMRLTGHADIDVYKSYSGHEQSEDFKKAEEATRAAFGNILEFKKAE